MLPHACVFVDCVLNLSDDHFNKKKLTKILVRGSVFIIGITLFGLILLCIRMKKLMQPESIYGKNVIDLPTFDFLTISNATNHSHKATNWDKEALILCTRAY